MNKTILITGGLGYIGSHCAVELLNANYNVAIIDNLSNSDILVLDRIREITNKNSKFFVLDVANAQDMNHFFTCEKNIDAIIHFAAYKAVGESVAKPLEYYQNNLIGIINILKGMQNNNIQNLIFSSSCTVYGQSCDQPVTENTPIAKAESPYGNTKIVSEQIIEDTVRSDKDIHAISLRYFNPIGAHSSAKIGELPKGVPNNLLPYITQTAYGLREKLSVFGNDYNTPDGTPIRDYINVVDLAKAHLKAVERLLNNNNIDNYEVFNIGTGKGNSVIEIIKTFEKVTEQQLPYQIVGRRAGDIEQIWADTKKANEMLGWKAEISIEVSIKSAWEWEKNYRELLKIPKSALRSCAKILI